MISILSAAFGTATAGALMIYGLYATVRTRWLPVRAFPAAFRQFRRDRKSDRPVSPFRAFATSLAGTIGVGNLTGVSLALAAGGPGAVFWMWVSAFLCMTVKYFEVFLAVKFQPKNETNYGFAPMVYLKKALKYKVFPTLFAILGLFSALTMGSMIQTNAAANAAKEAFGVSPLWIGVGFTAGAAFLLSGGIRRIMGAMEKAVPVLGGIFLAVSLAVIGLNLPKIPGVFRSVLQGAFSLKSAAGGFLGSGAMLAFRAGVSNGLFSHEAGLGSAGLAHGACGAEPERQGLLGMFEVFADTVVISTLSALMILSAADGNPSGSVPGAAGAVLGTVGEGLTAACLIAFAFLSVLSWSCYGETCFVWLCGKRSAAAYRILFLLTPFPAAFLTESALWQTAETVNGLMMLLNLTALIFHDAHLRQIGEITFSKRRPPS